MRTPQQEETLRLYADYVFKAVQERPKLRPTVPESTLRQNVKDDFLLAVEAGRDTWERIIELTTTETQTK